MLPRNALVAVLFAAFLPVAPLLGEETNPIVIETCGAIVANEGGQVDATIVSNELDRKIETFLREAGLTPQGTPH